MMRTAIFLGLTYIGDAIFELAGASLIDSTSSKVVGFYAVLIVAFLLMDIIDFIRGRDE